MRSFWVLVPLLLLPLCSFSEVRRDSIRVFGALQSDVFLPQEDQQTGIRPSTEKVLTNSYVDLRATSAHVDAGLRVEYLKHPLPGFENDFRGWGMRHFYVKGRQKNAELTLGSFYEQFGAGFILRTYEERSLGIDNALMGARLLLKPAKGITLKALGGKQRRYWHYNKAFVSGADVELNIDEWSSALQQRNIYLSIGASWLNKYEKTEPIVIDARHALRLPRYVNAIDLRSNVRYGAFSAAIEYAHKTQDPTFDNGYIYRPGSVGMLALSYSKKGASVILQAKRSVNMSFRSRHAMVGTSSFLNHQPAFVSENTYALASLYPYATQPNGEWAYQGGIGYFFKKKTPLGGKYGTRLKLNVSHVQGIKRIDLGGAGTNGYRAPFWQWGNDTYYQAIDLQVEKKLTKHTNLSAMYLFQRCNQTIVAGEGGMLHSHIFVADFKQRLSRQTTLRVEAQYLHSADGDRDWLYGLAELSFAPYWIVSVADLYNSGRTNVHYYQASVAFSKAAHRLQLGYGRTREGYNCAGGICRYVPATRGLTLSYNYNF